MNVDLSNECIAQLGRVVNEVQLSFAAANAPPAPPPPVASPADVSGRRSPMSILSSLVAPLINGQPQQQQQTRAVLPPHVAVHQQPARAHRRQARSLLVDAFRRHVLPTLKESLPSAYLLWSIQSEANQKVAEFNKARDEVIDLIESSGLQLDLSVEASLPCDGRRRNSNSTIGGDSEFSATSSSSSSDPFMAPGSPQRFLASVPAVSAMPAAQRVPYSAQLTRVTHLATRLGNITKLATRYEREEGKRQWLEHMDLTRDADKALRRAFSNGLLRRTDSLNATPLQRSSLSQSVTAAELDAAAGLSLVPTSSLEAIMEDLSDEESEPELDDRSSSCSPEPLPLTPTMERSLSFASDEGGYCAEPCSPPTSPSPARKAGFAEVPELVSGDDWCGAQACAPPDVPLPPCPKFGSWEAEAPTPRSLAAPEHDLWPGLKISC